MLLASKYLIYELLNSYILLLKMLRLCSRNLKSIQRLNNVKMPFDVRYIHLSSFYFNEIQSKKPYVSRVTHFTEFLTQEEIDLGKNKNTIVTGSLLIPALQTNVGVCFLLLP